MQLMDAAASVIPGYVSVRNVGGAIGGVVLGPMQSDNTLAALRDNVVNLGRVRAVTIGLHWGLSHAQVTVVESINLSTMVLRAFRLPFAVVQGTVLLHTCDMTSYSTLQRR